MKRRRHIRFAVRWLQALALMLVIPLSASPETLRLYLQGGGDLIVTEYKVQGDRVRYYSAERSQWEEIPAAMVDLEKTQREQERLAKIREQRRRVTEAEYEAERKARTELHNVPIEDGVYYMQGSQAQAVPQSTVITESSAKRTILQIITPIPVVAGKNTVEIEGTTSQFVVREARPVFFLRDPALVRFGIVRLEEKKDRRLVQTIQTVPKSEEMFEEQEEVEVFRQQLASPVYKVWPIEPLTPGEYAVIDYVPGQAKIRVWDFSYQPGSP